MGLWHERVNLAKKSLDQWADESGAKRFIKEYKGNYGIVFHTRKKTVPIPPINEVFSYVQTDIASMYNRDPYITVNAKAGTPKGAALWEVLLNYHWRELKTKEELEYEMMDKDLVGYAFHKVGHSVNSIGSGETLKIEGEKLFSNYISWKDVIWNIGAKRPPFDCQWMAHRIVQPLERIKKRYPAAKGLEGVPDPQIDEDSYKKSSYKDDVKVGVLWEIWDAEKKKILLLAEGLTERWLEPPKPWPDYLDEFPFLMYWDFIVPGQARPMSAIAPWEAQILEEMVLLGNAINHSKRWNRQLFYNGGAIDENAMDKYERGDDGAAIRIAGKVGADDLRFVDYGPLPTDFYLLMDRLQGIKRNINGQPDFVRGGVTKTGTRTVGELEMIQAGNRSRQDRKIDRLETHLENIARHMMAHLKANFDFNESLKITGELPEALVSALGVNFNPETKEITFNPSEIDGEYDAEIKAGSTLPLDKQTRMRVLELILQTLGQAGSQGPVGPFLNGIIQALLKDYDIKGIEEAYEQELALVAEQQQAQQPQQDVQAMKTQAEAGKRMAQTEDIAVGTEIKRQEAAMGPLGRAQIERMKKPELRAPD